MVILTSHWNPALCRVMLCCGILVKHFAVCPSRIPHLRLSGGCCGPGGVKPAGWSAADLESWGSCCCCQHRLLHAPGRGVHPAALPSLHQQAGQDTRWERIAVWSWVASSSSFVCVIVRLLCAIQSWDCGETLGSYCARNRRPITFHSHSLLLSIYVISRCSATKPGVQRDIISCSVVLVI